MLSTLSSTGQIAGLLDTYLHQISQKKKQKHEIRMKELEIIDSSEMKNVYAQQLILDKFLRPIEKANITLQNIAKAAQDLAESVCYYHGHHNATLDQAREIAHEARQLAIKLTNADSLDELKDLYEALTIFTHDMGRFRHLERKYSIEHHLRKNILDPLNTVIGETKNFQLRAAFTMTDEWLQKQSLPPTNLELQPG
ncbi:MAG: hypothetical protein HC790_01355 [Acaryochloridaceae cyanobacterium CSU_3_4]|nr:hypothetical protein [Acaryochloris sp. SU_5_25]NJN37662.1 hypothetical protein [Acaryochloridaceae cyanobacterium CSU_3_4]